MRTKQYYLKFQTILRALLFVASSKQKGEDMDTEYIHLEYSKQNWENHMFRTSKREPKYLLNKLDRKQNEIWRSEKSDRDLWNDNMKLLKGKRGKRPIFKNCQWCGVMLLKEEHTLDDVRKVAKWIEDHFGYTCTALAIHRDEGHNKKTGETIYNYHAHLHFFSMKNGKQMAREVTPSQCSQLQDITAEILGQKRGQRGSKSHHFKHQDYRVVAKERELQQELLDETHNNLVEVADRAGQVLYQRDKQIEDLVKEKQNLQNQLKDLQILKNKRDYLRKGGLNYRRQKKALKAQISALNLKIEGLNKSVATLTADKADLQSQLETAKGQILSDQQKADFLNKTINDFIEQGQLYTKKQYDNKEVTKTEVKLRDYTEQEKQELIDNAIATKIQNGELFTKKQYNSKPVTQAQIKTICEQYRKQMISEGWHNKDDYDKLSELKGNLIDKLKLAKKQGFQFTEQEVVDSVTDLMTALENSKKQAQDNLNKAISAYTSFEPKGETAWQTIKDLSEQYKAHIEKVEKEQFNEGVKADREYLNKHLNENPQLLHAYDLLNQKYQALEKATPTPVEVEVIKEVPRELNAEEIEQLPRVQNLLKEIDDYKSQIDDYKSQSKEPKPQEPQVEIEPYVPDTNYDEDFINSSMPEPKYPLEIVLERNEKMFNRIVESVCSKCGLNSNKDEDFEKVAQKLDNLRDFDLNEIPNLDFFDDFEVKNEIAKKIIAENSDLQPQKVQILSKKGRSR